LRSSQAKVFSTAIQKGGVVKGICIPKGGELSRKDLDDLTPFVATFGAKGIAWTKLTEEGWQSPIAKFLSEAERKEIETISGAQRRRNRRRQYPYPSSRVAKENSRPDGHRSGRSRGEVRVFPGSPWFRCTAPRWNRLRHRPPGDAFERRQIPARCDCLPQKS